MALKKDYPVLDLLSGPEEGHALSALADPAHPQWAALLDWQQRLWPGLGPKGEAAMFLNQLGFFIGVALMTAGPRGVGGAETRSASYRLLPPGGSSSAGLVRLHLKVPERGAEEHVVSVLGDPVAGLAVRARMGRGGLWRVLADGIALGLLDCGRRTGRLEEARHLFERIAKQQGSPLANRQLRWPEAEETGLLQRGGCCRIHEAGEPLCPGCVLFRRRG
ncbi:hypothetical protein [Gellertiella hungarica]|uniref:Ferric siderophore reductase C-terminal domain-containing protein n=1 Tax=Gellertiella hungarica TaxID=1572859 RepID=A0A7W6J3M5_9HYPH|nr:hypothetical protein [Gellertiella hungarica]MBB4064201.1 hypothetical protein [Gellertiella hungarica]